MVKRAKELKQVSVKKVLEEVQLAIDMAQSGPPPLPLKTVTIEFKTVVTVGGGVGLTIPIINSLGKIEGDVTRTNYNCIVLEPRVAVSKAPMKGLSESVRSIRDAIRLAAEFTPGLQFRSAKVKMDFTVTEEGSINFILTGKEALEGTHTITIEFEK